MSDGYDFAPYVPVWKRRAQAQRKLAQLEKRGQKTSPVEIEGRAIATTFWGKAWCENLEGFSDFANRLPRGRTYVRNGSVIDLQISQGKIAAMVSGSDIYTAKIEIEPLAPRRWTGVARECAGKIDSVVELLTGKLSNGVMDVLCRKQTGIFPSSKEIELSCSCPDGARLCKHLAAVLYGVGARLDHQPELLFVLRGVDQLDLVSEAGKGDALARPAKGTNTLAANDLSDIFGIEVDQGRPASPKATARVPKKSKQASRTKPRSGRSLPVARTNESSRH